MSIVWKSVKYADLTFNAGDLTKTTEHLISNRGQKIRATLVFTISGKSEAGILDVDDFDKRFTLLISDLTAGGKSTITRIDGGSFLTEGLIPGDLLNLFSPTAGLNEEIETFSMTDDRIVLDGNVTGSNGSFDDMVVTAVDRYTAVELKHNLQENEIEEQMESLIDGTIFTMAGNMPSYGVHPLTPKGKQSGGYQVRESNPTITLIDDCVGFVPAGCVEYVIEFDFYQGAFYEDSRAQCEDIPPQYHELEKCLTSIFEVTLLKNANNFNGSRTAFSPAKIGNTGDKNQNYNQGTNDFFTESVQFKELNGNKEYPGILLDKTTEINWTIKSINSEFAEGVGQSLFQPGFVLLLDDRTKYQELDTPYSDNVYFEYTTASAPATVGATSRVGSHWTKYGEGFSFVRAELVDPETVIIQMNFEPGPRLRNKLLTDEQNKFELWCNVGNEFMTPETINTVALTLPCNFVVPSSNIENSLIVHPTQFFESDKITSDEWLPTHNGYIQDDIIARNYISLQGFEAEITRIKVEILLKISSRSGSFVVALETWEVATEGIPFNEIKKTENRSYMLRSTDQHLERFIRRDPSQDIFDVNGDPIIRYLELHYALRFRWEDWVANSNVPLAFEDVSEPNNGLNERWNRYSIANQYLSGEGQLFHRVTADVKLGDETDQDIKEEFLRVGDYDEQMDSEFTWSSPVVKTFDPSPAEISPDVLGDDFTTLESTFVSVAPHGGVAEWYGEVKGDKELGGVNQIFSIHSEKQPLANGALIPEDGQNTLTISEVDANTIKTVCRIDSSKISGSKFIVTPRIGKKSKPQGFLMFTTLEGETDFGFNVAATMEMGDGTTITDSSIQHTYTSPGKKEILTVLNPSSHDEIDFTNNELVDWIDLRIMSSLIRLDIPINIGLEEIFFPIGVEWEGPINVSGCNLGVIDLSKGLCAENTITNLNGSFNFNLTTFIPPLNTGIRRFSGITLNDCDLNYFDVNQANYTTGFSFNLRNNQLTAEEVDAFLKDFETKGDFNLIIVIDGTNQAPTSEGLASKTAIEGLGGTVTVSV